jgi:hypothetical protein
LDWNVNDVEVEVAAAVELTTGTPPGLGPRPAGPAILARLDVFFGKLADGGGSLPVLPRPMKARLTVSRNFDLSEADAVSDEPASPQLRDTAGSETPVNAEVLDCRSSTRASRRLDRVLTCVGNTREDSVMDKALDYLKSLYHSITYYWTGLLILDGFDHSYLVGNLTNSKIAETKALEPLKS